MWILLEEKKIPYRVEKINMRSYGDKPAWFLQMVPNGLLPAIKLDGNIQTESLEIMLNLDRTFAGSSHPSLWPEESNPLHNRAVQLMRLERDLFARWCSLVFRSSYDDGKTNRRRFEEGLDLVNQELQACAGPWFLPTFSIVDLTYITHIERMCASVAYWCGFKIRGNPRWNAIDAWMEAFEQMPSYMATKSDYYTHVMDIPPQYGQPYPVANYEVMANQIDGKDTSSWRLPLKDFDAVKDVEPIGAHINPGEELARQEAAYKLLRNYQAIARFALRATGSVGKKRFQAPLADPYAEPNLAYEEDMLSCLKLVASALLEGNAQQVSIPNLEEVRANVEARVVLVKSLTYLRERVGVPRDMSYPAARQFRAHLNWMIDQLQ